MVCQICGKKSGYYPLCKTHNELRGTGKVKKCDTCGKWIDTGYPLCKSCYSEEQKVEKQHETRILKEKADESTIQGNEIRVVSNRDLRNAIEGAIENAEKNICILSPFIEQFGYLFSDLQSLIQQKGNVRIIFKEAGSHPKYIQAIDNLIAMGAEVQMNPELHAKLVIVDDQLAIISSANLLARSFLNNEELGIQTSDPQHVNDVITFFNQVSQKSQSLN